MEAQVTKEKGCLSSGQLPEKDGRGEERTLCYAMFSESGFGKSADPRRSSGVTALEQEFWEGKGQDH